MHLARLQRVCSIRQMPAIGCVAQAHVAGSKNTTAQQHRHLPRANSYCLNAATASKLICVTEPPHTSIACHTSQQCWSLFVVVHDVQVLQLWVPMPRRDWVQGLLISPLKEIALLPCIRSHNQNAPA